MAMSRQEVVAIAEAVLKQLRASKVKECMSPEIVGQIVQNLQGAADTDSISRSNSVLSSSSTVSTPSGLSAVSTPSGLSAVSTPSGFSSAASVQTPQFYATESSVSRSSSGLSASSASSFTTPPSTRQFCASRNLNFAEVEDEVFAPKKRRKRNNDPENAAIVQAITRPVMEEIDTKLLAPYVSPLFKRFFKRQRINGRRVLRRKSEMDMVMFKDVIRPILRRLLERLRLPVKDQVAVYSKYYRVAIAIVKKRRANHVQSWRVHGKPKKPIYDVLLPPHHESQLVSELSELPGDGDDKMGEELRVCF